MSNIKKMLCRITFLLAITFIFGYDGKYQYVKANDLLEDEECYEFEATEPIIDIANCSVSYNGELGDFVEWKIKPLEGYENASIEMSLKAPNGNIVNSYYSIISGSYYEIDENGYYTFRYWVDEWGAGDGVYQIHRFFVLTDDNQYTITNGYNGVDFSRLSFTVSGQKQDKTAPVIDKDNIVICKEELTYANGEQYQEVQFQVPIKEIESGIQSIMVYYGPYDSYGEGFSSGWNFYSGRGIPAGVRPNPLGVVDVSVSLSELDSGVVYGLDYIEVKDCAGNTTVVNLASNNTDEYDNIDVVPEQYRFTTDNLHVHTYSDEWTTDILPSCSEYGVQSRHCTTEGCIGACDFEEFGELEEHVYGEWKVTKEATCKEPGLKESYCSACEEKVTEEIPVTGQHAYGEWKITKEATCKESGLKENYCFNCEEKITEEIPVTAQHTYGEWVITKEAICNENGSRERSCSVCGTKETEEITATGYTKGVELAKGNNIYVISAINGTTGTVTYKGVTKKIKTVKVPDKVTIDGITYKVTSIADNALANNKKVTKVVIGKNVTSIGKNAFKKCTKLKTVEIKSTKLNKIGANAFYGAKKLTKITLKTTKLTKKSIGKNALKGTNKKLVIKVPKSKVKTYKTYFKNKGNKTVKVKK